MPDIFCYPGSLNQVFMNIILNAIQAIPQRGTIRITTRLLPKSDRSVSDSIEVVIQDSGMGIRPEIRQKIFDPFFTTREVGQGVGLGLTISYSIVEKHEGNIDFKSEPGKGTEFIIRLPVESAILKKRLVSA